MGIRQKKPTFFGHVKRTDKLELIAQTGKISGRK